MGKITKISKGKEYKGKSQAKSAEKAISWIIRDDKELAKIRRAAKKSEKIYREYLARKEIGHVG